MGDRDAVSVLVPTVEWNIACEQLAAQISPGDELLVICDSEDDPVTSHDPPAGVEILVAGEPDGCSGKANAMAHGMERAENDRFVWTDADFERDPDWLDRLVAAGEAHGPASALCVFVGDGWFRPYEVWSALFFSLAMYLGVGEWGGSAWGGGVTFTADELETGVDALTSELRQVISDDGLLSDHLGDVHPIRSMIEVVEVPGDLRTVIERTVRLNRIVHVWEGGLTNVAIGLVLVAIAVAFPIASALLYTALGAITYWVLGVRRLTFLLIYPAVVVVPIVALSGIVRKEFEWTGRRYRLNDKYDVEVVDR
ncbi:glycosyltransferase [Halobaculum sp. EA56]|uniref:glycosyltransferase n=1 Tax=Halobaculum sp. EA56 TaxID=3421648 RepID=UPI003EBD4729